MAGMLIKVACVVIAFMVVVAPYTEAITCNQVVTNLLPCLGYLRTGGPVPPVCCQGLRRVNAASPSTPDRRAVCNCVKGAYNNFPGIKVDNVASLPGKCGVNLPYKFTPSIDCSKVQ